MNRKRRVFVLYGLGGAGKTQLALKVIATLVDVYSDIMFVDASSRDMIEAILARSAAARYIGNTHLELLQWIEDSPARRLLVFDNANDPDVRLNDYFPPSLQCDILITTRHHDVVCLATDKESCHNISGLEPEEAQKLLLDTARTKEGDLKDEDRAALMDLLREFDCLALAIVQAGAFIWKTRRTVSQYYALYSEHRKEALEGGAPLLQKLEGYGHSVYTTWELSFYRLSLLAKNLLVLIVFLNRSAALEDIFQRAGSSISSFVTAVPPTVAEKEIQAFISDFLSEFRNDTGTWSPVLFLNVLSELVSWSLLMHDPLDHIYTVHPLVQAWAQAMTPDQAIAASRTTFLLAISIPQEQGSKDHAFRRAMLPHINEVLGYGQAVSSNWIWPFLAVYDEIQQFGRMEVLARRVMEARKSELGEHHPDTLRSITKLVRALRKQALPPEVIDVGLSSYATYASQCATRRSPQRSDNVVLGCSHHSDPRLVEAENLETNALAELRTLLGESHRDTLSSMANLAITYRTQNRLTEAETLGENTLTLRRRVLGEGHIETLQSMASLALTYRSMGRLDEAADLASQALEARTSLLGKKHPETMQSMAIMGRIYASQGRFTDAESMWLSAVTARTEVLGGQHPSTLRSMRYYTLVHQARCQKDDDESLSP